MKLVSLTMVRVDGDVIEEFVRHTARFVDRLFVYDMSADSAGEILVSLQREGLPLTRIEHAHRNAVPPDFTDLTRSVFERTAADFILLLDADEFIIASGREALEAELRTIPRGAHGLVPWTSYVPTMDDDASEPRTLARIRHRRRTESVQYYKAFVSSSFARRPNAAVIMGNHGVEEPHVEVHHVVLPDVGLAHFPVRSIPQVRAKALLGWSTIAVMGLDDPSIAYQWRRLHARLRTCGAWTNEDLCDCALTYLDAVPSNAAEVVYAPVPPVPRAYTLQVPDLVDVSSTQILELAEDNLRLRAENRRLTDALRLDQTRLQDVLA